MLFVDNPVFPYCLGHATQVVGSYPRVVGSIPGLGANFPGYFFNDQSGLNCDLSQTIYDK